MESVSFDGVVLTDTLKVLSTRGGHSRAVEAVEVPGRDDLLVRDARKRGPSVTLHFFAQGTAAQLAAARREIGALLSAREPKRLQFGGDGGLYYMAVPDGEPDWSQFVRSGRMDVPFLVPSPAMYGEEKVATVPSGGSVTVEVLGTYPTAPTATAASAVRSSSSSVWGLRLDNGIWMHVDTGSSSSRSVVLDCGARRCTVAGSTKLATLDSTWFSFEPGSHTVRMDNGTGAAVLRWQERWLA